MMKTGIRYLFSCLLFYVGMSAWAQPAEEFYGTDEPFASEAVYFVLTDRFVDADAANNHETQGQGQGTWERRMDGSNGQAAFVGYMGGDFKGIYDNADYIKGMGFTAVWITPVVDNPDQTFTGGDQVVFGSGIGADKGKTGYHGYWGVDFFRVDEHLESPGFSFQEFTRKMRDDHGLKIVLDIVGNHGSPSFDMEFDQPKFGELYDETGALIADHQNLPPEQLDPDNPLHQFFNRGRDIGQLSDLNPDNPDVLDYIVESSLQWIDQGAAAFRIDTIKHQPHRFWKQFSDRIRGQHPGFFMFGESFSSDAGFIAQHQRPENGGISVLDFPGKDAIRGVFERGDSDYSQIDGYLHLTDCVYTNPYELATFYDNHDMARMNASETGFIDAHNWLFTTRGIPVVYYGSESRFMAGTREHTGNRNFFGPGNISTARNGEIFRRLKQIADIRKGSVALQKGLQENLLFDGRRAAFYRVYEKDGNQQTALVLLNKGDQPTDFTIDRFVSAGSWRDAETGDTIAVTDGNREISTQVGPHDVKVLLLDGPIDHPELITRLSQTMKTLSLCRLPRVEVEPEVLMADGPVTVRYRAQPGKQVALHWGIDNWNGTGTPNGEDPMTFNDQELVHEITLTLPAEASQLDFVFHNLTDNTWDSNGGRDWHYQVISRPPQPPATVSAEPEDGRVRLQWGGVANATSYTAYFTDDGSDPNKASSRLSETAETQLIHEGLTNGSTYRYRIASTNAFGESALSEPVSSVPGPSFRSRFGQGSVLRLTGEAFSGWAADNAEFVLGMVDDYTWSGQVAAPQALRQTPYKLTLNGAWTVNWGGGATGANAELARGGANASVSLTADTYTLKVTEGTSVDSPVTVNWIASGDPVLAIDPAQKNLIVSDGTSESFDIRLSNAGGGELVIEGVATNVAWLTATVDPGQGVVTATADTTGLGVGETFSGTLTVDSNGGSQSVQVDLTVIEASPQVAVAFTCQNGHSYLGQSVYVVGNLPELGTWRPADGIKLDPTDYPNWTGAIELPADADVEWKCVKREEQDPNRGIDWQPGPNNQLCTRADCQRATTASF